MPERSLEIAGYKCVQMTDIAELEIGTVLKTFGIPSGGSAKLYTKDHTALIIKPIARLDVHGIGAFKIFYIPSIDAGQDFVVRIAKDVFRDW